MFKAEKNELNVLQTLAVYIFLTLTMFGLVRFSLNFRKEANSTWLSPVNFPILIALLSYTYIFGVRYGVGVDYPNYLEVFNSFQNITNYENERMEVGFTFLTSGIAHLGFHYSVFFGIVAFSQLGLIFYTFRKQRDILPFLVLTFMLGAVWLNYANGLRQQLAFCIFVFSLHYVFEKKILKHYLLILLAISMHKSAWVLVIVYPILTHRTSWFNNIKNQYLLLAVSLILLNINIIQDFFTKLDNIATLLGYSEYMNILDRGREDLLLSLKRERGIGFYTLLLADILLIYKSNEVKRFFSSPFVASMYDLYFVGVLWSYIFNASIVMGRPNYYMLGFKYIIAAFTLCYLYKSMRYITKNKLFFNLILFCYLLMFIATIYRMEENTAQYIFYWQTELYHLKN